MAPKSHLNFIKIIVNPAQYVSYKITIEKTSKSLNVNLSDASNGHYHILRNTTALC